MSGLDEQARPGALLTAGLVLAVTLVGSESLAIGAVMPAVANELGDRWLYGWAFSAFALGNLVGITTAGSLADRAHPWRPFAIGLVLFSLGLLLGGVARSMPVVVLARLVQGLGGGAIPATAYVCIARAYPATERPRMFALLATAWLVPGVAGPSVAVAVGAHWGWRWVFLGLLPLVVVCGALAVHSVRAQVPSGTAKAGPPVVRDALLAALGAASALAGLTAPRWDLGLAGLIAGAVLGVPPYRRLTPPGVLRGAPGLPAVIAARGLLTASFFSVDSFVSLALSNALGAPPWVVGVTLSATTLLWVAGAWVQERTISRIGPRRLIRAGFFGLAMLWLVAAVGLGFTWPLIIPAVAFGLAGAAIGPAYSAISVTSLDLASGGVEGRTTAGLQLTEVLGVSLGTGVTGAVIAFADQRGLQLTTALGLTCALASGLALCGWFVARGVPRRLSSSS